MKPRHDARWDANSTRWVHGWYAEVWGKYLDGRAEVILYGGKGERYISPVVSSAHAARALAVTMARRLGPPWQEYKS